MTFQIFVWMITILLVVRKRKCRYEIFSADLNKYLSNAEKKEDGNKIVFIVHCVNSLDIFYSYYNLAVNKYIPTKYF